MKLFLSLISIVALAYAGLVGIELLTVTTSATATVWQQISARIGVGLALLVFVVASGVAAVLDRLDASAAARLKSDEKLVAALSARVPVIERVSPLNTASSSASPAASGELERVEAPSANPTDMSIRRQSRPDAMTQAAAELYSKPAALR